MPPDQHPASELLDVVLITAGFLGADSAYRFLYPDNYSYLTSSELWIGVITSIISVWVVVNLLESTGSLQFIDLLLMGTGVDLMAHALLNYFDVLTRSLFMVVAGVVSASVLLLLRRMLEEWLVRQRRAPAGTLILAADPVAYQLASAAGPVVGVAGKQDVPALNRPDLDQLQQVVLLRRPARIVVNDFPCEATGLLLDQRMRGVDVCTTSTLYERQMHRIDSRSGQAADLLLAPAFSPDSRTLSVQAIYNNLIGLFLLLLVSPVLLAVSVAILLSSSGPIFETVECAGFRNIPFLLMRYRTTRADGTGRTTWIGSLIKRLHLVNLPQLFNVVRGEMALFGPRPARTAFSQHLAGLLPCYPMRLSVKPGLLASAPQHANELVQFEYDLYYIKYGSLQLDLEILYSALFQRGVQDFAAGQVERFTA